jgi:hypothetical protein
MFVVYRCLCPLNINFVILRQNPSCGVFSRTSRCARSPAPRVAEVRSHAPHGASYFPKGHSRSSRGTHALHGALTLFTGHSRSSRGTHAPHGTPRSPPCGMRYFFLMLIEMSLGTGHCTRAVRSFPVFGPIVTSPGSLYWLYGSPAAPGLHLKTPG